MRVITNEGDRTSWMELGERCREAGGRGPSPQDQASILQLLVRTVFCELRKDREECVRPALSSSPYQTIRNAVAYDRSISDNTARHFRTNRSEAQVKEGTFAAACRAAPGLVAKPSHREIQLGCWRMV